MLLPYIFPVVEIEGRIKDFQLLSKRKCDTEEKFESSANRYKQYLIGWDYKPSLMNNQFQEVSKIAKAEARAKIPKNNQISKIKFLTICNPSLPKIDGIIRKDLSILICNDSLKELLPTIILRDIFKRNKNLKEQNIIKLSQPKNQ